ncbi:MAG TPA: hypothetical protein PLQ52_03545, partial [Lacunisphaera sp.]|nr:hypothetical protein [Lacunisphaera sp.]
MSQSGRTRIELEAARREQLRLEQVRTECRALIASCEESLAGLREVAVQQFAAAEGKTSVATLRSMLDSVEGAPDVTHAALVTIA